MEDLRNKDIQFKIIYVPTSDSYTLIIDNKSYRITDAQFTQLHNDILTTMQEIFIKKYKLGE